jgi:[acyl-carrier-protein] S-malonyltransferase
MIAFVFPGQGSQSVGMGKEFYEIFPVAREVFQEVDDVLKQNLTKVILEGPEGDLLLTQNTQPALMTVSLAILRVLEKEGNFSITEKTSYVAGHSLGEYSAYAAVGTFSLADTARLLRTRGQAMQNAVPVGKGAMAALLGGDLPLAQEISLEAAQGDVCEIANDNSPGQVVLSGHKAAIERAIEIAKQKGIKRAVILPVSAPFHSSLMQPAAKVMEEAFKQVQIQKPALPVIANVLAEEVEDFSIIPSLLVQQVTDRVRWRESMLCLKSKNVQKVVEIGAGKVLSGLAKRIDEGFEATNISTPQEMESFLKSF